jgi:hypothetical protein
MSESNIIAFGLAMIGILCIIVSFTIAHALARRADHFPLAAKLVLSGFPFPLSIDLGDYIMMRSEQDILEWYAAQSIVDHATLGGLIMVGLLTAWLVLKKPKRPVNLDAFR